MDTGYRLCCRQCGYAIELIFGVGFAYPKVYIETQEEGNQGKLGDDIKEFLDSYHEGVIDPMPMIAQ